MIYPVLKSLHSPDLEEPALPADPACCSVLVQAIIGPPGEPGEESFDFLVVTPAYLEQQAHVRWGRGLLIVPEFAWATVRLMLAKLLPMAARESWSAIGAELNKEMHWEFDNYRP